MENPHKIDFVSRYEKDGATITISRSVWLKDDPAELLNENAFAVDAPFFNTKWMSDGSLGPKHVSRFGRDDAALILNHMTASIILMSSCDLRVSAIPGTSSGSPGKIFRVWDDVASKSKFLTMEIPGDCTGSDLEYDESEWRELPVSIDGFGTSYIKRESGADRTKEIVDRLRDGLKNDRMIRSVLAAQKEMDANSSARKVPAQSKRQTDPVRSSPKPRAVKHAYPRKGKLAMGDTNAFTEAVDRDLRRNEKSRAAGINQDFAKILAEVLEDAFQCGVIFADTEDGCKTHIPKDPRRRLMHLARSRDILAMSSLWTTKRDDDITRERMIEAGQRAFQDGKNLSKTGSHSYEDLFISEPTEGWRVVPTRYDYSLYKLCKVEEFCRSHGCGAIVEEPTSGDGNFVVRPENEFSNYRDDNGNTYFSHVTLPCLRSLAKVGLLSFDDQRPVVGQIIEVSDKAMEAFAYESKKRDAIEAENRSLRLKRKDEVKSSFKKYDNGFYRVPVIHKQRYYTENPDVHWVRSPVNPTDIFGKYPRHFGNTGTALIRDPGFLTVNDRHNFGGGISKFSIGAEMLMHMVGIEDIGEAPYDRERFWTPAIPGIGSDAFRIKGTSIDIILQQIDPSKKDRTIQAWERSHGLSVVEINTFTYETSRVFLMAKVENRPELEAIAEKLQSSYDRSFQLAPVEDEPGL